MVRSVGGDWDFLRCSLTRCVVVVWRLFLDERLRVGCGSFEVFGGLVVEIGTWEDGGRENESGSFVPFRLEEKGSGSTLLFSESRLLPFGLRSLAKLRVEPQQYHNIGASRGQVPLSLFFPSTTHFFPLHPRSIKLLPSTNSLPVASHPLQKHHSHLPASLIFQSTPVIPKSPGPVLISESTAPLFISTRHRFRIAPSPRRSASHYNTLRPVQYERIRPTSKLCLTEKLPRRR